MRQILTLFCCFISLHFLAQVQDNFNDGDFTQNPSWMGDDSVFVVFDDGGDLKLRSNKTIASSTFYLSTASSLVQNTQFEFSLKLSFNTSSTNFVDVFLTADQSNLMSATLNGYFVRIGGTSDEISLYKSVNGAITEILDGTDAVTNSSSNNLKIKVVCSATGDWDLQRDLTGTGNSYASEGVVNDVTFTTASFFGIKITQSTASFFQKHFLNDVYVGPIILDVTPPTIVSTTVIDANNFDVLYSENVDQVSVETTTNYDLQPFNSIATASRDGANLALVHYVTSLPLANGNSYTFFANNINDLNSNTAPQLMANFTFLVAEVPAEGDVVISEFFCDPSPRVGLAEIEFVEIFNKSGKVFHLQDWQLGDNATSGTITDGWILPGEYKVLCPTSAVDSFPNAIGVTSFPSLNNSGDNIVIRDTGSVVIDSLTYTDAWYRDEVKKEGGYTVELINPNDPCSAADNWIASTASAGGTPGAQNSVFDATPDTQAPSIVSLEALAPNFLKLKFSEGMDSLSLVNAVVGTNPSLTVASRFISGAFPDSMMLIFVENLNPSTSYQIQVDQLADCWNNTANLSGNFILADNANTGDLVINEILFDPYTGGYDFVEIRNNSSKVLDLFGYRLANYDDSLANIKTINEHFLVYPNDFVVISADTTFIMQHYTSTPGRFIQMAIPTYSNDSATVYLLDQTKIIDQVSYKDSWHFELLNSTDGVSLERIDPFGSSNDENNWHSASEMAGFATPGYENSQLMYGENDGNINLTKAIFSPDSDGNEDVLQINYEMINEGKVANLTIYDDRGRKVKELVKSDLIGNKGTYTWDGVADNNQKASIGTYVLLFDAYDLNGKQITKKIAFVLAGKL